MVRPVISNHLLLTTTLLHFFSPAWYLKLESVQSFLGAPRHQLSH
jgi:hypothetical protein